MDTIILAAGRNDRLKGIVPPFMKPLMLVNGEPLIVQLMRTASTSTRRFIIVAAPENVQHIVQLLEARELLGQQVHIVIQPEATGPLDAVRRALPLCDERTSPGLTLVCILCGDNVIPPEDFRNTVKAAVAGGEAATASDGAICTKVIVGDISRFTVIDNDGHLHPEGEPKTGDAARCWVGPVVVERNALVRAVSFGDKQGKISQALCRMILTPVTGNCSDIGVPEAIPQ